MSPAGFQLDFVYYLYGTSFALLATFAGATRFASSSAASPPIPWFWLGLFAAVHAAHEWLEMASLSIPFPALEVTGYLLLPASYALLFEFSRRAAGIESLPLRALPIIAGFLLAAAGIAGETDKADGLTRLLLAAPASGLAAVSLFRRARTAADRATSWAFAGAALAFLIYSLTAGLTPPPSDWGVGRWWNSARWLEVFGFPVQVVRAFCAIALATAVWRIELRRAIPADAQASRLPERRFSAIIFSILLTAAITYAVAQHVGARADREIRDDLARRAGLIAGLLDKDVLSKVLENPIEGDSPARAVLDRLLSVSRDAYPEIEQIYLYSVTDGRLIVQASSTGLREGSMIRTGDEILGSFPGGAGVPFTSARAFVYGPFRDRGGHWVSAIAPALYDPHADSPVQMALGIDIAAERMDGIVGRRRLIPLALGAFFTALLLDFHTRQYRLARIAAQLAAAERLQRNLSEELERRVVERTNELAQANAALSREMARHRESEAKYRALTERLPAIPFRVDLHPTPRTTYISPRLKEVLGYEPADWLADPEMWKRALHPEDRSRVLEAIREADQLGVPFSIDFRMISARGDSRHLRAIMTYEFDNTGAPAVIHGVMLDITEEVERDRLLREAGERYRQLFERSPTGIFQFDRSLRVTDANPRFADMLRTSRSALVGADIRTIASANLLEALQTTLSGGECYIEGADYFLSMSSEEWIAIRTVPLPAASGGIAGGVAIVEDLSDRRRAEEERMRTQKLESLTVLAGGIAHDFNNILTAILGNISLARENDSLPKPASDMLRDAERAALRARDLTRQLMAFTKGGPPQKSLHHVPTLIREAAGFTLRGSACRCEFDFAPDTWLAELDAGQFTQAIQNLLINADQAMPGGGLITIRTANRRIAAGEIPDLPPGPYVQIQVSDTGIGIPEHHLTRIFDPYFSTKKSGSGLGLTMCYAIVRKHRGHIRVESEVGKGTTFTLLFPAETSSRSLPEAPDDKPPAERVEGRILLMDDESAILTLGKRALESVGFTVLTARRGEEALEIFDAERAAGRAICLAILDLTVPDGMGGRETLARLRERDPRLPVVASSGYARAEGDEDLKQAGFTAALPKPYRASDLIRLASRLVQLHKPATESA